MCSSSATLAGAPRSPREDSLRRRQRGQRLRGRRASRSPRLLGPDRSRWRKGHRTRQCGASGSDPHGSESPDHGWMGDDPEIEKRAGDAAHSDHRAHLARDGRRTREGACRRLRRLRHQAGKVRAAAGENSGAAAAGAANVTANAWRLLIVDDNEDNRLTLSERLAREGYGNVEMAADGRRALELIEQQPFDLVLLDIMMPQMNGYEVLERLHASPQHRSTPVIV